LRIMDIFTPDKSKDIADKTRGNHDNVCFS